MRNFYRAVRTIFHAHTDLIDGFLAHAAFYGITGKPAADRADDGAQRAAIALANLVTQHCAQHTARNRANANTGRLG